jgi:hypothetical protein
MKARARDGNLEEELLKFKNIYQCHEVINKIDLGEGVSHKLINSCLGLH